MVLFGDSTTALRNGTITYGEKLAESFDKYGWGVEIFNAGKAGNTTQLARRRFKRDVLDLNPTLVVIQFGINDAAVDVWKVPPASNSKGSVPNGANLSPVSSSYS